MIFLFTVDSCQHFWRQGDRHDTGGTAGDLSSSFLVLKNLGGVLGGCAGVSFVLGLFFIVASLAPSVVAIGVVAVCFSFVQIDLFTAAAFVVVATAVTHVVNF